VPCAGRGRQNRNVDTANKAADNLPRFSPDGKKLVYRAQRKAGYEADKWEMMLVDVSADGSFKGEAKSLTKDYDRSIEEFVWATNDQLLFSLKRTPRRKCKVGRPTVELRRGQPISRGKREV